MQTEKRLTIRAKRWGVAWICGVGLLAGTGVRAHFQVIMPSTDIVTETGPRTLALQILFTHPMEQGPVMNMGAPREFGVVAHGRKVDLRASLEPITLQGKRAYTCKWKVRRPGDFIFYIAPAPYWEPAEEKMIIHYTKVVVDAFDAEEGWDAMVGFPVEIEPLVRPYGLWTGNVFRGVVRKDGNPVPFAEIEAEYWNEGRKVKPPSDPYVTQVIKADGAGCFSFAMPRAGWWGFAALVPGEKTANPEGRLVDTELGGLIWVRVRDMR
ncbi:MAG: DUF4198 domain-containing protein [Kiritimatiellaeota bacterium]|nr:DUF4198 domain-containing protein [Kiritimatiellota bacterium]